MIAEKRKFSTIVIALVAVITLIAIMPPSHFVEGADTANGDIFTELGFDTNAVPSGYSADSNPTGRDIVRMNQVSELSVREDSIWSLFGDNEPLNPTTTKQYPANPQENIFDTYLTAYGDFTGSGLQSDVVVLGANTVLDKASYDQYGAGYERPDRGLWVFFVDPLTGLESSANPIYNGTIGNSFELNGYLSYDPALDSYGGTNQTPYNVVNYTPIMLQNYMQVVTGDFTGDGVDEIAIYNPNPAPNNDPSQADPRIEVYQLQAVGTDASVWQNWENWHMIYSFSVGMVNNGVTGEPDILVPNRLSMAVGDIDNDGVDDLAIAYSYGNLESYDNPLSPVSYSFSTGATGLYDSVLYEGKAVALLGGVTKTFSMIDICTLEPVMGGVGARYYSSPSVTFGDLFGSGRDSLILVEGYSQFSLPFESYSVLNTTVEVRASICQYSHDTGGIDVIYLGAIDSRSGMIPLVNPAAVAYSPGGGATDRLFYYGLAIFANSDGSLSIGSTVFKPSLYDAWTGYGVKAVDLDNDFADEIVLYDNIVSVHLSAFGFPDSGFLIGSTVGAVLRASDSGCSQYYEDKYLYGNDVNGDRFTPSPVIMATPDTDKDTTTLTFQGQYLAYTDPKILAVMAGAPVYKALEGMDSSSGNYISGSGTSWSSSTGTSQSSTTSGQITAGAYVKTEKEFEIFGIKGAKFETELEYSFQVTWETEQISTMSETVEYSSTGYADQVALYSIPVAVYVYEASVPTDLVGGTGTTLQYYNIPFSPAVTVMTADEYDQVVTNYSNVLPAIRGGASPILTHTQGDPSTYPSETAAKSLKDVRIFSGNYSGVGYGYGSQTQTLSIEQETSSSTTYDNTFSFKMGGGAGGVELGVKIGGGFGFGSATVTTSGSDFTGTVNNMPEEARPYGYNYNWKVMQYWYDDGNGTKFPIVSYVVQANLGGIVPIAVPYNLAIDTSQMTASSITLTWSYPANRVCTGFKVFRYNVITQVYEVIALVPFDSEHDSYSYTDTGLAWGAEYSYYVQAVSYAIPNASVPTDPISGWTLANNSIKLELSQYDLTAYADKVYLIKSTLTSVPGATTPTYSWEKLVNGTWTAIGITTPDLSISNVRPAAEGQYRLNASQQIGNAPSIVYSPILTIKTDKRIASIELKAEDDGNSLTLSAILRNTSSTLESGSIPSGSVSFEVSYNGGASAFYTAEAVVSTVDKTATATYTIPDAGDGLYDITAIYGGNTVFKSTGTYTLYYIKGDESSIFAIAPSSVYYGDTFSPQFYIAEKNGDQTDLSLLNGLSDYVITFTSLQVQKITGSTWEFIPAIENTDYSLSGTDIIPLNLDPDNFTLGLDRGVGNSYHYIATYSVESPDGSSVDIELNYIVNKRPVMVVPAFSEISKSDIVPMGSFYFNYSSLAFGQTFDYLFKGVVENNIGRAIVWNSSVPMSLYTIYAQANDVPEKNYYDFTFVKAPLSVTGQKYAVTINAGDHGSAYLTSQTDNVYVFGNGLYFTAYPDDGYEVDTWTVEDAKGVNIASQPGGLSFFLRSPASDTILYVTFQQKDIHLTYAADPSVAGTVDAVDGDGMAITYDSLVMEGSPVVLTATPGEHYEFGLWRIYYDGPYPLEQSGIVDENTGKATLSFNMSSVSTRVEAVFVAKNYEITLGDGLNAWYMYDDDNNPGTPDVKVTVSSGDMVAYGTMLTVEAASGLTITEWTTYPATAVFAADDQSCTYIVDGDASFQVSNSAFYPLTVDTVANGSIEVRLGGDLSTDDFSAGVQIPAGTEVTLTVIPDDATTYTAGFWIINGAQMYYGKEEITFVMNKAVEVSHELALREAEPMISFDKNVIQCMSEDGTQIFDGDNVAPGTVLVFSDLQTVDGQYISEWLAGADSDSLSLMQTGGSTFTMTMPGSGTLVVAVFEDITISVSVNNGSYGTYALDCGTGVTRDAVPYGSDLTLTVTPDTGYSVKVMMSDGVNNEELPVVSGSVWVYSITDLRSDITLTISYIREAGYNIVLDSTGVSGGIFSASATTAKAGETVTLSANAYGGFYFVSWNVKTSSGDTVQVTQDEFIMPADDVTVKAVFEPITVTTYILMIINGTDVTGSGSYTAGTVVSIKADPAPSGKTFDGWMGGNGGTFGNAGSQTTTFTMPANNAAIIAMYASSGSVNPSLPPVTHDAVTGITMLTKGSGITINGGDILQLSAVTTPANASNPVIVWTSSNPFVANVDSTGQVAALKEGTSTITAITSEGGYKATFIVNVSSDVGAPPVPSGSDYSLLWLLILLNIVFGVLAVSALYKLYRTKGAGRS